MLQERILNTLEKHDHIDQRKLSRVAGLNESSISRYLNGFEDINFESLLRIVQFLYPEQEIEIMSEQIMNFKSKNARLALEYAVMNLLSDHLDHLLDLLSTSSNPVDKEWAAMYEFIRLQNNKELSPLEFLKKIEVFKPKELEMQILKTIVKGYTYVELNDYNALNLYIRDIEPQIGEIKSNFIQESFNVRLGLIMNYVSLYSNNDPEQARYYSSLVIEQDFFEHVKATAYHNIGHSYLFESYDQAKDYLERSITLSKEQERWQLAHSSSLTLSFIQSFWEIEREFPFELKGYSEISEYIFFLIRKGDKEQAKDLLEQIDIETISDWDKGFHYYYLGLIYDDKDFFYDSVEWFKKKGDKFHLMLPIKELHRLKENEKVLRLLTT